MNLYDDLKWRGTIFDETEGLRQIMQTNKVTGYIGFDPTAASLHVGSLLPVMVLARMQKAGHTPIAVVGGGTGLIGDPSGKSKERTLLSEQKIEENLDGLRSQLSRFLDFQTSKNPAIMVNNADWLTSVYLTVFLRDIGKHFSINAMLAKDSVKRRIESEDGLSFTEFSYMLLQSMDFLELYKKYGCVLQMGGSDQWGNIVAGIELIRKKLGKSAYGLVFPLLTTATGSKFGKTESGTIWLDKELTSPFKFYQYWLNANDADVFTYLKLFTFLNKAQINDLEKNHNEVPHLRRAQKYLAKELTLLVHGEDSVWRAEKATTVLFGGEIRDIRAYELEDIFSDVPSIRVSRARFAGEGIEIAELICLTDLATSKRSVRQLLDDGGLYLNNRRVETTHNKVTMEEAIDGKALVLRRGKKKYYLVRIDD